MIVTAMFVGWVLPVIAALYFGNRYLPERVTNHPAWAAAFLIVFFGWFGLGVHQLIQAGN